MLAEGIATAQYFAMIHVESTKLLVNLVEARGQRGFVGLVSMDRNAPETYVSPSTQQALDDAAQFVEYTLSKKNELVVPVLTPRFIPTCSLELLHGLGDLAAKYEGGLYIQSHAAESLDEEAFVEHLHPGKRDTEILNDVKLLTKRACMAHAVHLTDDELAVFQQTGTSTAHCPLSKFFFANGFLDLHKAFNKGVAVGLGNIMPNKYYSIDAKIKTGEKVKFVIPDTMTLSWTNDAPWITQEFNDPKASFVIAAGHHHIYSATDTIFYTKKYGYTLFDIDVASKLMSVTYHVFNSTGHEINEISFKRRY